MGQCVEILLANKRIRVRDSKQNSMSEGQPHIEVDAAIWRAFLSELLGLTTVGSNGTLVIRFVEEGWVQLSDISTGTSLLYDQHEWTAFIEGVALGEMGSPVAA